MAIELGGISFDESSLSRQLRADLRDDWFPDPLNYGDILGTSLTSKHLVTNFSVNHGAYIATERDIFNIPKRDFTLRYALETSIADRAIYNGLALSLVPYFDPLLPWNVFSHRWHREPGHTRYMFRRGVPAWQDFTGAIRSALQPGGFLLTTDVANYFDNIDLFTLAGTLHSLLPSLEADAQEKAAIRAKIDFLFTSLKMWCFKQNRGLPQNRDASSFLANIYMYPVDQRLRSLGYHLSYFRYMDDIKIICPDVYQARKALKDLSLALREVGLSVNAKKTAIVSSEDSEVITTSLDDGSDEIKSLDAQWQTRSRDTILAALPRLKELALRLLGQGNVDTREFRFCMNRLTDLAQSEDIFVPKPFFSEVTSYILALAEDHPAATDIICKYLLLVPTSDQDLQRLVVFLRETGRSIYSWQNHRVWLLLAQKGFRDSTLDALAGELVRSGQDTPNRAGASIYLGALGDKEAKSEIALGFHSLRTFVGQRSALLAVHELPFSPLIEKHVKPFVRPDLQGVYKGLQRKMGTYFSPAQKKRLTSLTDEEPPSA